MAHDILDSIIADETDRGPNRTFPVGHHRAIADRAFAAGREAQFLAVLTALQFSTIPGYARVALIDTHIVPTQIIGPSPWRYFRAPGGIPSPDTRVAERRMGPYQTGYFSTRSGVTVGIFQPADEHSRWRRDRRVRAERRQA
jgi:hypothetical protein